MNRFDTTCWTMIFGAADGNATDREVFVEQYAPVIRAYLSARWRLPTDHEQIHDATQEVFLQCFKQDGALESIDSEKITTFRAFLYGVAQNVALMTEREAERRRRDRGRSELDLDRIERSETSIAQAFDRAWAMMIAREARLTMKRKGGADPESAVRLKCLELRYSDGSPPRDIARELGIDVRAVYKMLVRAREEYHTALMEVVSDFNPLTPRRELEERCKELLELFARE